jgi:hypothetical protein
LAAGIGSPVTIVHAAPPLEHHTVHRDFLARADAQAVTDHDLIERDVLVLAVGAYSARGLRRQAEQSANGAASAAAGPQLQHLAEKDQHGNDGRRFEVRVHAAARAAEGRRKGAWGDRRDEAEQVRGTGADADQREHVQAAVNERRPHPLEERRAGPEHHWSREYQLHPAARGAHRHVQGRAGQQVGDHHEEQRRGQCGTDPETQRHVAQLDVGLILQRDSARLEGHPADRARPRSGPHDLGMHGAGPLGRGRHDWAAPSFLSSARRHSR